ncbi:hypothetical protein [Streptomyces avicenniae]|uniref:hypothetical protein n=1 Tax=Streptomyces avicenniae TaxID=500153 RepID=UPI00069B77B2|nr:hypothetical protein [Streptomyces avicenniae]
MNTEEWLVGACWLWCGHRVTLVRCVGAVSVASPPGEAPLYACGRCLEQLEGSVADYGEVAGPGVQDDGLYVTPGQPSPPPRPRTRRWFRGARTVLGRRWRGLVESGEEPSHISPPERVGPWSSPPWRPKPPLPDEVELAFRILTDPDD